MSFFKSKTFFALIEYQKVNTGQFWYLRQVIRND